MLSDPMQRTRTSREIKYYGNCRLEAENSRAWPIFPPANNETFIRRAGCALHVGCGKILFDPTERGRIPAGGEFPALAAVGISH